MNGQGALFADIAPSPPAANWPLRRTVELRPPAAPRSVTSLAGAAHVAPKAPKLRAMVLAALGEAKRAGQIGLTIQEIAQAVGQARGRPLKEGSSCARVSELRALGLVRDSGHRRQGDSGVLCVVWALVERSA